MAVGRPSMHTPELAKEICDTIASSTKGLHSLCQMHAHWPSYNAIYEWINDNREGFGDLYAKAKESQADYLCDDILRIIDKPETYIENGVERNDVAMMRLKVDSMKWQAMKLKPRRWGDKQVEETNPADTLTKIRDLVADLNKTNVSDI
jgi:hypothetical protein